MTGTKGVPQANLKKIVGILKKKTENENAKSVICKKQVVDSKEEVVNVKGQQSNSHEKEEEKDTTELVTGEKEVPEDNHEAGESFEKNEENETGMSVKRRW